jgi:hypothetical protein
MQRSIHKITFTFGSCWLVLLAVMLTACGGSSSTPASNVPTRQSTSPSPISTSSATPTTTIKMGPQPCPAAVASASNWDAIIPTQPPSTKVESVTCGNLMGVSSLQAMVTVRTSGVEALLDVYVYNHLTDPHPNKVFALMGLYKGDAKISNYNSLLTAEVDPNSSVNKGKSDAEFVQDLSREFKWSDNAATLVPTAFPGIFPDITRYQAEGDQQAVNQGDAHWKLDASIVASNFATTLLKWPSDSPATIVSGGGQNDKNAVVSVKNPTPAGGTIKLTMDRLELNTNGGIWIVTNAVSDGTAITEPDPNKLGQISSPVSVKGKGNAFEAVIGKVFVLDHNYNPIGTADARTPAGAEGNGNLSFSTNVTYTSTFKNGLQDGLVVVYSYSNADGSIAGIAMSKVLLT